MRFHTWREGLISSNTDIREFVQEELYQRESPLLKAGWRSDTLLSLFLDHGYTMKYEGTRWAGHCSVTLEKVYAECCDCVELPDSEFGWIQPKWMQRVERIKRRSHSDGDSASSHTYKEYSVMTNSKKLNAKLQSANTDIPLVELISEN